MTPAVLLALAMAAAAAPAPAPAPAARPSILGGEPAEFKSVDGWDLHAVWRKAEPGKPTVVLLHGTGQRKEDWRLMTRALTRAGDGWLALDLRGHGESRTTPAGELITWHKLKAVKDQNDYEDMTRDAEAAVGWLTAQGVIEESIGVEGAEVGGSVAAKYAAVHPKVPFLIMLSPGLAWRDVPIVNAIRAFKGRGTPILMVQADADKVSARETPLLYAFAKMSVGERDATLVVVPEERGTRMLARNKGLAQRIADWIANPIAPEAPAVSTGAPAGVAADTSAPAGVAPDTAAAPGEEQEPAPAPDGEPR